MAIGNFLRLAAGGLCAALLGGAALAGDASQPAPAPQSQASATQTNKQTASAEDQARRQAYLRFMEAQRLKGLRPPRLEEAIAAYKDAIRLDPTAAEPHADLGELYFFYLSRRAEAEREGLEAVRLDPKSVDGHKLLARLYVFAVRAEKEPKPDQLDRAIRAYEEVTKLDSGNAEAWAFLAELYQMKGDSARQMQALERWTGAPVPTETGFYRAVMSTDLAPDQAFYQLSQLYLQQDKKPQALSAARRAYEMDPESNVYARNLVSVLRLAETGEQELEIYAQLTKTPSNPTLYIGYGSALVRAGRYPEAAERLREYLKQDPSNTSAVGLLSIAQRRANQRAEAAETLKQGIARSEGGTRTSLMLELAETYEEMGRADEAIAQLEQVLESLLSRSTLTPQGAEQVGQVVNRLAGAYRRAGHKQKLQQLTARARQALGENNSLLDMIAVDTLREEGKRREALELTRAAARRHPDDRSFKFTEALILGELGDFKAGIALLRGMLKGSAEEAGEDATVYLILSSIQMQSGELAAAEQSARKALEISPDQSDLLIQLSAVQDRAGQHEASEQTLRAVLQREPDNATALNNLGYFLTERGTRYQEALGLIEKAINIEPTNGSFLDSLGWVHYKLGHLEKAREYLEKATSYARRNSTVHEHLGDVLRDLGRVQEARRHWEKALEYSVEADEIARLKDKLKK
jgi:tetratricopeptide (TPR) repeat protein